MSQYLHVARKRAVIDPPIASCQVSRRAIKSSHELESPEVQIGETAALAGSKCGDGILDLMR